MADETTQSKEAEPSDAEGRADASRWQQELADAKKRLTDFHATGHAAVEKFRSEKRPGTLDDKKSRLNLFAANVQQVEAMLFAQTPTVDVERRFADAKDAVARVSAELLGRILNEDLQAAGEEQILALKQALSDRLLCGLGTVRVRYDVDIEDKPVADAMGQPMMGEDGQPLTQPVKSREEAEVVYVHWQDQLWDPLARVFSECRWWAFRVYMTRKELVERFGEKVGRAIPLNARRDINGDGPTVETGNQQSQAEVWEIWDKERREVCWYADGHPSILDKRPPPMELQGFWPFPRPMFANAVTDKLVPRADYAMAEDLYREVDEMVTRRAKLVKAVKAVGVYDQACEGVQRMLTEGTDNQLIPVPNWSVFAESGGVPGSISWLPLDQVLLAIEKLGEQIEIRKGEIYEITGWSDIMRGQQVENGTPGEAALKTHFASARLNAIMGDFARLSSDVQRLRAEIIAKYFDPETIIERSNAQYTYDSPDLVMQAVQLIKSGVSKYRVCIKSDALALADYGARRQEATEVLAALGGFVQQAGQVAQAVPGSMPFLLELLKWTIAKVKGGQEIGGLLDRAIEQAEQQAQQPQAAQQPDPKLQADQMKHQNQMQALQAKTQADLVHMQAETQQMGIRQRDQAVVNIAEEKAKAAIKHGQAVASAQIQGVTP